MNFVIWGLWHGLLLIFARYTLKLNSQISLPMRVTRTFLCFHLIVFSWLLFRIGSIDKLLAYIGGILRFDSGTAIQPLFYIILLGAALVHFTPKYRIDALLDAITYRPPSIQAGLYASLILLFIGVSLGAPAFIYFQF